MKFQRKINRASEVVNDQVEFETFQDAVGYMDKQFKRSPGAARFETQESPKVKRLTIYHRTGKIIIQLKSI